MHLSMFVFHVSLLDFEAMLVPSKPQESLFYNGKSILFTKAPFREKHQLLDPFSHHVGIILRPFLLNFAKLFGVDFLSPFFPPFLDLWCHFRRPRDPNGDRFGSIPGIQKGH